MRIRALPPGTEFTPGTPLHRAITNALAEAEKNRKAEIVDEALARFRRG